MTTGGRVPEPGDAWVLEPEGWRARQIGLDSEAVVEAAVAADAADAAAADAADAAASAASADAAEALIPLALASG